MKLKEILIFNYKSIETINISIKEIEGSFTFGLVGVNEAGKTAILKAISMFDNFNETKPTIEDFYKDSEKIEVYFNYEVDKKILAEFADFKNESIFIGFEILKSNPGNQIFKFKYNSKLGDERSETIIAEDNTYKSISDLRHKVVFWTYDNKYLLDKEVEFNSQNFTQVINQSIPLKNCFSLARISIEDFQKNINNSIEREGYQEILSTSINKLIKQRWPNQHLNISFNLTENKINFHIKDLNASRAQKLNQRSDGFRQFLSFLLSIGAESVIDNLSNTIVLLDEPETHLHPQAQKFFLQEIITLTKTNNNILLYTTHSGFLIDNSNIDRTARVVKDSQTNQTELIFFSKDNYSFSRINYEIFEAEAEGYHNELYDKLRDKFAEVKGKTTVEIRNFDDEFFKQKKKLEKLSPEKGVKNKVTLPTYVRNCIHYPENKTLKFQENLKKSIELLVVYSNEK